MMEICDTLQSIDLRHFSFASENQTRPSFNYLDGPPWFLFFPTQYTIRRNNATIRGSHAREYHHMSRRGSRRARRTRGKGRKKRKKYSRKTATAADQGCAERTRERQRESGRHFSLLRTEETRWRSFLRDANVRRVMLFFAFQMLKQPPFLLATTEAAAIEPVAGRFDRRPKNNNSNRERDGPSQMRSS